MRVRSAGARVTAVYAVQTAVRDRGGRGRGGDKGGRGRGAETGRERAGDQGPLTPRRASKIRKRRHDV